MEKHRIAVVALDGVTALDPAIPLDVFTAERGLPYEMRICGMSDRITLSSGVTMVIGQRF